jgi:hypothetical protein
MGLQLREDVSIVRTDYGSVLLDERSGGYYQLNPTGTLVVRGLLEHQSEQEITKALVTEYEVSEGQAEADVAALVQQLIEAKLVQP